MHMLLHAMAASHAVAGAFDISSIDGGYLALDEDGFSQTGNLSVKTTGAVDWTGDTLGSSEGDDWWLPNNTIAGTWHVQLTFDSGTNVYSSGESLSTWLEINTDRQWNFSRASAGGPSSSVGNYTLAFSNDGGSTTYDSVAIAITMEEQSP